MLLNPEAFYRIRTLDRVLKLLSLWGFRGQTLAENGFRAFQDTKMSPKDTQLLLLVAFILPKIKLCS